MTRVERHKRLRKRLSGTRERPRLSVYRSLKGMWVQIIDDEKKHTIASVNHKKITKKVSPMEQARMLGGLIASAAKEKHISHVIFDRGGYRYHGRIKALADAAREGGLIF